MACFFPLFLEHFMVMDFVDVSFRCNSCTSWGTGLAEMSRSVWYYLMNFIFTSLNNSVPSKVTLYINSAIWLNMPGWMLFLTYLQPLWLFNFSSVNIVSVALISSYKILNWTNGRYSLSLSFVLLWVQFGHVLVNKVNKALGKGVNHSRGYTCLFVDAVENLK